MHGLPSLPGSAARVESPLTPLFRAHLAIELARCARGEIEDGRAGNGKRGGFPTGTPAPAPRAGLHSGARCLWGWRNWFVQLGGIWPGGLHAADYTSSGVIGQDGTPSC